MLDLLSKCSIIKAYPGGGAKQKKHKHRKETNTMNIKLTRCEHGGNQKYVGANRAWMWIKFELENGESFDCRFDYFPGAWAFFEGENSELSNEITNAITDEVIDDLFTSANGEADFEFSPMSKKEIADALIDGLTSWRNGNVGIVVNIGNKCVVYEDLMAYLSGADMSVNELSDAEIAEIAEGYAEMFAAELVNL